MEIGAGLFRDGLVRGVADQDVAKAEGVFAAEGRDIGSHQLLANQGLEVPADLAALGLRGQRSHGAPVKDLADDAGALGDRSLLLVEPLQPGRQQRRDRGGNLESGRIAGGHPSSPLQPEMLLIDQRADHLLEEEGVPLGAFGDVVTGPVVELSTSQQVLYE